MQRRTDISPIGPLLLVLTFLIGLAVMALKTLHGASPAPPPGVMFLTRNTYEIGMAGVHPKIRGGSGPSRVSDYCKSRNIPVYNVSGSQTMARVDWARRLYEPKWMVKDWG
jgi:hypothetical protein